MASLDVTPFVALSAYSGRSHFVNIFRPFLDLGGEPCPVGPINQDDKPKFSFKALLPKYRRVK